MKTPSRYSAHALALTVACLVASGAQAGAPSPAGAVGPGARPPAPAPVPSGLAEEFGRAVNVRDFGAKGDGATDDGEAINAAVTAAADGGGAVYFPAGTYAVGSTVHSPIPGYLNNAFVELKSRVSLVGAGSETVIRVKNGVQSQEKDGLTGHVFQGVGVSQVTIRDLVIDMNGPNNLTPAGHIRNGHAIRFMNGGSDVRVEKVTVLNNPGHNDIAANGAGRRLAIAGCNLRNGGHFVTGPRNVHNADFSFAYSEWSETTVANNSVVQDDPNVALQGYTGGIELHGSNSRAVNNLLKGCDPGVWVVSAPVAIANVQVADNKMERCLRGVAFWNELAMTDVAVERNVIEVYRTATSPSAIAVGIHQPNGSISVFGAVHANGAPIERLRILDNVVTSSLPQGSELLSRGIELHSVKDGLIARNRIDGMTEVGLLLLGSPWGATNLIIENNEIVNCGRARGLRFEKRAGIRVDVVGAATKPKLPYVVRNVRIRGNTLGNRDAAAARGGPGVAGEPGSQKVGVFVPCADASTSVDGLVAEGNRRVGMPLDANPGANGEAPEGTRLPQPCVR